ncbi:hypothetical protein EC036_19590 [Enterobacter cloacae]|nr:hypothetical protein EC036_19590 [Enterobacter cloacae]
MKETLSDKTTPFFSYAIFLLSNDNFTSAFFFSITLLPSGCITLFNDVVYTLNTQQRSALSLFFRQTQSC